MARVVYASEALSDLERLVEFHFESDPEAAAKAAAVIDDAVAMLARHPLVGRLLESGLRELVISYGRTGYVALYRFIPSHDEVRVLRLRHQRELDYP